MPLRQQGDYWYGDGPADVWEYFVQLTRGKPFVDEVTHWKQARCSCGHLVFNLFVDEESQIADRVCAECGAEHRILNDPEDVTGNPELDENIRRQAEECDPAEFLCICELDEFEVLGVTAPFPDRPGSAKWFYLGVRCVGCGCLGRCTEAWLERYNDAERLLALL
jgi:hypothetical protein